jgi:hypothetical protein
MAAITKNMMNSTRLLVFLVKTSGFSEVHQEAVLLILR